MISFSRVSPPGRLIYVTITLFVVGGIGALGSPVAHGQAFGRVEDTESNVAYFFHARPGDATVQVSVWGAVPKTGIYEVPDTTSLNKLLTMAGGIPGVGRRSEQRDPPEITIRMYRPENGERTQIFESRIGPMLEGNPTVPPLRDDDIVVVETEEQRQLIGWRDVLSLLSTLGSLTLLGLRLLDRR